MCGHACAYGVCVRVCVCVCIYVHACLPLGAVLVTGLADSVAVCILGDHRISVHRDPVGTVMHAVGAVLEVGTLETLVGPLGDGSSKIRAHA